MHLRSIAILGTGAVGIALAKGFAELGCKIVFGTRNVYGIAAKDALSNVPGTTAASFEVAAATCEAGVIALPWAAIREVLTPALAMALAEKTVIDTTNPLVFSTDTPSLVIGHTDSAGETVQRLLPESKVVKAFNIISAAHMVHPLLPAGLPDMIIAGNEPLAKSVVGEIIRSFGWRNPIDLGDITQSRLLEPLAMIWITYAFQNNHWSHGFSLLGQRDSS